MGLLLEMELGYQPSLANASAVEYYFIQGHQSFQELQEQLSSMNDKYKGIKTQPFKTIGKISIVQS